MLFLHLLANKLTDISTGDLNESRISQVVERSITARYGVTGVWSCRSVAEADNGNEAIRQAALNKPDVVLMDIRMPQLDGLAATEQILRQPDPPTIVVLTTFDQNEYVYRALRAGAAGFLLKDAPSSRLIAAVRAAATGDSLIEPSITQRLVERFAEPTPTPGVPTQLALLTERELDVLRLIARGLSNAEIAAELVVAETTVKTHVARILTKLGVRDRVQAVVVAYETGFVNRTGR